MRCGDGHAPDNLETSILGLWSNNLYIQTVRFVTYLQYWLRQLYESGFLAMLLGLLHNSIDHLIESFSNFKSITQIALAIQSEVHSHIIQWISTATDHVKNRQRFTWNTFLYFDSVHNHLENSFILQKSLQICFDVHVIVKMDILTIHFLVYGVIRMGGDLLDQLF
jgi:hypothetical protein